MATTARGTDTQPPFARIEDHGIIGDLHTAALVSTEGDIDWLCLPRFDSPSVFAALLDQERGGRFTMRCAGATHTKQMYLPDSNILLTRFLGENFVGEVVDFMVPREQGLGDRDLVTRGPCSFCVSPGLSEEGSPSTSVVRRLSTTAGPEPRWTSSRGLEPSSLLRVGSWCCGRRCRWPLMVQRR